MFADFLPLVMDSLINQAAKYWYISNEQASVPLVVRSAMGAGGRFGAMHSQSPIPWLQGIPGIKVVAPATAGDAKALLKASIRDENPVVFLEHKRLYSVKDPVAGRGDAAARQGRGRPRGRRRHPGRGLQGRAGLPPRRRRAAPSAGWRRRSSTCARCARSTPRRCCARWRRPTAWSRSRRARWSAAGPSGLLGIVAAEGLHDLDDAWAIACPETPIPYSPTLEDEFLPAEGRIVAEVAARLGAAAELKSGA